MSGLFWNASPDALSESYRLHVSVSGKIVRHSSSPNGVHSSNSKSKMFEEWHWDAKALSSISGTLVFQREVKSGHMRAVKIVSRSAKVGTWTAWISSDLLQLIQIATRYTEKHQSAFVKLLGWYEVGSDLHIVFEHFALGNPENHVQDRLTERSRKKIARQVADAVCFLHERSIWHLDIRPANIYVVSITPEQRIKLGLPDNIFRQAESLQNNKPSSEEENFIAPETLQIASLLGEGNLFLHISLQPADLWSIGALAWWLSCGKLVCVFKNVHHLLSKGPGDLRSVLSLVGATSHETEFIIRLMKLNPEERPTIDELLVEAWVQEAFSLEPSENESNAGHANSEEHDSVNNLSPPELPDQSVPFSSTGGLSGNIFGNTSINGTGHTTVFGDVSLRLYLPGLPLDRYRIARANTGEAGVGVLAELLADMLMNPPPAGTGTSEDAGSDIE